MPQQLNCVEAELPLKHSNCPTARNALFSRKAATARPASYSGRPRVELRMQRGCGQVFHADVHNPDSNCSWFRKSWSQTQNQQEESLLRQLKPEQQLPKAMQTFVSPPGSTSSAHHFMRPCCAEKDQQTLSFGSCL